jgi:hypothetical protein
MLGVALSKRHHAGGRLEAALPRHGGADAATPSPIGTKKPPRFPEAAFIGVIANYFFFAAFLAAFFTAFFLGAAEPSAMAAWAAARRATGTR